MNQVYNAAGAVLPRVADHFGAATLPRFEVHRDILSSWTTAGVLGLVAVAMIVLSTVRRRRGPSGRRPHRVRAWSLRAGALVSALVAVAIGVNAYVGYVPDVEALRLRLGLGSDRPVVVQPTATVTEPPGVPVAKITQTPPTGVGAVGEVHITAPAEMRMPADDAWVYTPPGFDSSGAVLYPTMYLLHGAPGSSADWTTSGAPAVFDELITSGTIRPMIVISPDVNAEGTIESSCLDSTKGGSQVESYLTGVVVPWVDTHYPVALDRVHRAIGGMSSGAFCALDQGLRHQDLYGTILGIMPYGEPGGGGEVQLSTPQQVAEHTPNSYVDTIPLTKPLGVFLDYGSQEETDEVGTTARHLAERLKARGVNVLLRSEPNQNHTWTMTMMALPYGVQFFEQQMAAAG